MALQPVHRTGPHSRAQARRLLNASRQMTPRVAASMISGEDIVGPVAFKVAEEPMKVGVVTLVPGDHYAAVESERFRGCYYVARFDSATQTWQFSGDPSLAEKYIDKIKEFDEALLCGA